MSNQLLMTVPEVAELLRTSTKAIYVMAGRKHIPGVVRIRKRLLFNTKTVLEWVEACTLAKGESNEC